MGKLFGVEDPLSVVFGEDLASKIPGYGALTGSKSNAQKDLEKKQKEIAAQMAAYRPQLRNANMNSLTQQLGAFGPRNAMLAQFAGPQAAFSGEQFAQMGADPFGQTPIPPELMNYRGTDPKVRAQIDELMRVRAAERKAEEERKQSLMGLGPPPGSGPTPMSNPQAAPARRYR